MKEALLLSKEDMYFVRTDKDFSTKDGVIKAKELSKKKYGDRIRTHLGKEFLVAKPTILDIIEKKVKRSAQVILPKDAGIILAYTGIRPDSLVLDAGTGTGYLAIFIGNFVSQGKVITYEKDKSFFKIAGENIKATGLTNIKIKNRDVTKGIEEKNADLITLDLQDSDKVIKHAYKALKIGGYLVVYSPTADHLMKVAKAIQKQNFNDIKTIENIIREWQTERTVRPKTMGLMHTGFITFARKI